MSNLAALTSPVKLPVISPVTSPTKLLAVIIPLELTEELLNGLESSIEKNITLEKYFQKIILKYLEGKGKEKQLQKIIGDSFVIKRSVFNQCLEIHPMNEWNEVVGKVNQLNRLR